MRQCLQGVAEFRISPSFRGCYTLPKQARYQLRYTPFRSSVCDLDRLEALAVLHASVALVAQDDHLEILIQAGQ